jgi:DNA repair protein RecN (Recombination protein N)
MFAANPGLAASPLGETASGGEVSRVLLALLAVTQGDGSGRMLVFDEVDAGIGGRTAVAVGRRLSELSREGQVLCITHLAPVAAVADRHFSISKSTDGTSSETEVTRLEGEALVLEMLRMLGAEDGDAAARAHVSELLAAGRSGNAA